jgi:uncharacterized protein YrrD
MQVRLGAPVFGIGGKRLGEVEALIADAGTKRAHYILVDEGLLDRTGHLVAISAITRAEQDGIHLDATGAQTNEESPTLDSEEVAFAQRVEPPTTFIPAAGVGGPVIASDPAVPGEYPDDPSFFDIAPIDPPPVEIESNLGENEVRLSKGIDVLSADGHKIGDVTDFTLGDMGLIEGITVSEGLLLKHTQQFALAEIQEIDSNAIHLRVTREEAKKR